MWGTILMKPEPDLGIPATGQPSHLGPLELHTHSGLPGLLGLLKSLAKPAPLGLTHLSRAGGQHGCTGPGQVRLNVAWRLASDAEFKSCGLSKDSVDLAR